MPEPISAAPAETKGTLMQSRTPGAIRASIPASFDWGIGLAIGAALISGLAVYLNAFAVKQLPDAAVYTTLKNGVAAAILIAITLALGGIARPGRSPVVGGVRSLPSASSAAACRSSCSSPGLPRPAPRPRPSSRRRCSSGSPSWRCPSLARRWVSRPWPARRPPDRAGAHPAAGWDRLGSGETMILVATLLWAAETIVVRRLLGSVSSHLMGALRMGVGLVGLVGYLAVTGKLAGVGLLTSTQWAWALLTGVILRRLRGHLVRRPQPRPGDRRDERARAGRRRHRGADGGHQGHDAEPGRRRRLCPDRHRCDGHGVISAPGPAARRLATASARLDVALPTRSRH